MGNDGQWRQICQIHHSRWSLIALVIWWLAMEYTYQPLPTVELTRLAGIRWGQLIPSQHADHKPAGGVSRHCFHRRLPAGSLGTSPKAIGISCWTFSDRPEEQNNKRCKWAKRSSPSGKLNSPSPLMIPNVTTLYHSLLATSVASWSLLLVVDHDGRVQPPLSRKDDHQKSYFATSFAHTAAMSGR